MDIKIKKEIKMKNKFLNSTLFLIFILAFAISLVYAAEWIISTQSNFDEGTYNNTYYNTTNDAVQLNLSYDSKN
jgi:hypothetical protein